MTLTAPKKQVSDPAPKGNHIARLYQIIHIGTSNFEFMGEMKSSDKVRLTFELCNERKVFKEGDEPKPLSISREFGLSMGRKSKLRPFIESMTGSTFTDEEAYGFDLESLLGSACLLNVVHVEKTNGTYADIASATPLVKGMVAPEQYNESKVIDVNSTPEEEIATLPDFIKNKIYATDEWQGRMKHAENMSLAKKNRPSFLPDATSEKDEETFEPPF